MHWIDICLLAGSTVGGMGFYVGARWNKEHFLPDRIFHRKKKADPVVEMVEWKANRRKEDVRYWLEEWARLDPPDPRYSTYTGVNPYKNDRMREIWEQGKKQERIQQIEERIEEVQKKLKTRKKKDPKYATGPTGINRPTGTYQNPTVMTIYTADGTPIHLKGGN